METDTGDKKTETVKRRVKKKPQKGLKDQGKKARGKKGLAGSSLFEICPCTGA